MAQHRTALFATFQHNISLRYKSYIMSIGYSLRHYVMSLCADEPPSLVSVPQSRRLSYSWTELVPGLR